MYACFGDFVVLWNTYGDCDNIAVMKGHTGAIMDLHFSTDGGLVSCMLVSFF